MSNVADQDEQLIDADAWMLTLSDLLLLLLSMFVMMLSMADFDSTTLRKKLPTFDPVMTEPTPPADTALLASLGAPREEGGKVKQSTGHERPELFTVSLAHSFTHEGTELTFDAGEVLTAVARTAKEGRLGVTVELFLPLLAEGDSPVDQRRIIERARVVIRQLIDAGVEREALATRVSVTPMTPDQASEEKGSGGLRLYLLSRESRSAS